MAHRNGVGRIPADPVFTRLQEFGPDRESGEEFTWAAPDVTVALDFAPTEAIERYRIGMPTPCPCASK